MQWTKRCDPDEIERASAGPPEVGAPGGDVFDNPRLVLPAPPSRLDPHRELPAGQRLDALHEPCDRRNAVQVPVVVGKYQLVRGRGSPGLVAPGREAPSQRDESDECRSLRRDGPSPHILCPPVPIGLPDPLSGGRSGSSSGGTSLFGSGSTLTQMLE